MISEDPPIREFLLQLSYRQQELLCGIAEKKSVHKIAVEGKLGNERTLSSNLAKLDDAFYEWTGQRLVDNPGGRKGFQLTDWGRRVASVLGQHHRRLTDSLIGIVSAPDEIEVALTNDCMAEFGQLQKQIWDSAGFMIRPKVWRTADIYEYVGTADKVERVGPCAFYSSVPPVDEETRRLQTGDIINVDTRPGKIKQLLVLKTSEFKLLAPKKGFGFTSPVDLQSVLEAKWELVVPEGGAVYEFLRVRLGQWDRVGSRLLSTDLTAGLDILRYRLRPQRPYVSGSIMIVHDLDPERIPDDYMIYDIQPPTGQRPHQALTGLMRDVEQLDKLPKPEAEPWETIWDQAVKLWRNDAG